MISNATLGILILTCILSTRALLINPSSLEGGAAISAENSLTRDGISEVRYQPRHIHIAYGNEPTEMTVTWSTIDPTPNSLVEYGKFGSFKNLEFGTSKKFVEPLGRLHLVQYIHRVTLKNLTHGETYVYHCGSDLGISEMFMFRAMREGSDWSPTLAVYGDLGNINAQSLTHIQLESQDGLYDAVFHVGDFAYDMDTDNGLVGDAFMDQIQPIAGYLPYMTCPGNHEGRNYYYHYKNRFTMPGNFDSMLYSFNLGSAHFISISTEFYYFLQYGIKDVMNQYDWIVEDLKEANKPENRAKRPWIITFGHRPMYCSNNNTDDCTKHETRVRVGVPFLHWFGLEDLFMENGVDLAIWAHEHSYERMWPMYNHTVYNGTDDSSNPYKNPKALVHLTTGSAGCQEKHDDFVENIPDFTAFRTTDYGYSRLKILNKTHLYMEQVSVDQGGKVIDSFTLVREAHKAYTMS